jgi:hypothetical protein
MPAFGAVADAQLQQAMGGYRRPQGGAITGAVGAQQGHELAQVHCEIDAT